MKPPKPPSLTPPTIRGASSPAKGREKAASGKAPAPEAPAGAPPDRVPVSPPRPPPAPPRPPPVPPVPTAKRARPTRRGREGKATEDTLPTEVAQLAGLAKAASGVGRPPTSGERSQRMRDTIRRAQSDPDLLDARIPLALGREIVEELVDVSDDDIDNEQLRIFKKRCVYEDQDQRRAARASLLSRRLDKVHDHTTVTVQVAKMMQDAQVALEVVKPAIAIFGRETLERLATDARVPPNVVKDLELWMRGRAQTLLVQVAAGKEFKP